MAKQSRNRVGRFQPDLFQGSGIKRPALADDRATELELARQEMMDSGAQTIFGYLDSLDQQGKE